MRELDRLIRRAGGVLIRQGRHRIYDLFGERVTLHCGSRMTWQAVRSVRAQVNSILRRRQRASVG